MKRAPSAPVLHSRREALQPGHAVGLHPRFDLGALTPAGGLVDDRPARPSRCDAPARSPRPTACARWSARVRTCSSFLACWRRSVSDFFSAVTASVCRFLKSNSLEAMSFTALGLDGGGALPTLSYLTPPDRRLVGVHHAAVGVGPLVQRRAGRAGRHQRERAGGQRGDAGGAAKIGDAHSVLLRSAGRSDRVRGYASGGRGNARTGLLHVSAPPRIVNKTLIPRDGRCAAVA